VWRLELTGNRLVLWAIGAELLLLGAFLGWQPLAGLLGGAWPGPVGWACAAGTAVGVIVADGAAKAMGARRGRHVHRQLGASP
jgi:hypothetical protein